MTAPPGTVGLLHPGEMGAAVGAALQSVGISVLWVGHGRSQATRDRAAAAGLTEVTSMAELLRASAVVLSICPPGAAVQVAQEVAAGGFRGAYVDCNAASPQTARRIGSLIQKGGASFVDGGIVGGPPGAGGDTRLYLSGEGAAAIAAIFQHTDRLTVLVLEGPVGAASALKMCYAAWTKGTTALLLAIRAAATVWDVDAALLGEWELSQPELAERFAGIVRSTPRKAWRFVAEMDQIAESWEAADLPPGFHRAAAELFARLSQFRDQIPGPGVDDVLSALVRQRSSGPSERETVAEAD